MYVQVTVANTTLRLLPPERFPVFVIGWRFWTSLGPHGGVLYTSRVGRISGEQRPVEPSILANMKVYLNLVHMTSTEAQNHKWKLKHPT